MWNGTGGQPESHIGAVLSKGGRAISLLKSTAQGGAVSRIVPQFEEGTVVAIPRYFADYVVTEYGAAHFTVPVAQPRHWTAETPHLYTLVMALIDAAGATVDVESCRVGFRQICRAKKPRALEISHLQYSRCLFR